MRSFSVVDGMPNSQCSIAPRGSLVLFTCAGKLKGLERLVKSTSDAAGRAGWAGGVEECR